MGSHAPSGKGHSKSHHGQPPEDRFKKAKVAFVIIALVGTAAWLIAYFDPFEFRKPDPGPPPDTFIEQLPAPERERAKKQLEKAQEEKESGTSAVPKSGA